MLVWEMNAAPDGQSTDEPVKKKRNINKEVAQTECSRAWRSCSSSHARDAHPVSTYRVRSVWPCAQLTSKNWGGRRSRSNQYAKVDEQETPPMTAEEALAKAAAEGYVLEQISTAGKCALRPRLPRPPRKRPASINLRSHADLSPQPPTHSHRSWCIVRKGQAVLPLPGQGLRHRRRQAEDAQVRQPTRMHRTMQLWWPRLATYTLPCAACSRLALHLLRVRALALRPPTSSSAASDVSPPPRRPLSRSCGRHPHEVGIPRRRGGLRTRDCCRAHRRQRWMR